MNTMTEWPVEVGVPRVKVCGLTREKDGIAALKEGASFLGLIFAESPRRVSIGQATRLLEAWREHNPNVHVVGVFVNEPLDEIRRIVNELELFAAQVHGQYNVEQIRSAEFRVLRAFSVVGPQDDPAIAEAQEICPVLLDGYTKGKHGGTGKVFDHSLAIPAIRRGPVFIAGGLNPLNVEPLMGRLAVDGAVPYALDVSSGLENLPGEKSAKKIVAFFEAVRRGTGSKPEIQLP